MESLLMTQYVMPVSEKRPVLPSQLVFTQSEDIPKQWPSKKPKTSATMTSLCSKTKSTQTIITGPITGSVYTDYLVEQQQPAMEQQQPAMEDLYLNEHNISVETVQKGTVDQKIVITKGIILGLLRLI